MVIQLLVVSRLGIEKFLIILKTICQSNINNNGSIITIIINKKVFRIL